MSFYRQNALPYAPPLQVWACPNTGDIVIPAEYHGQQHIAACEDCGTIYSLGRARESGKGVQVSLSTDVVMKAEQLIDAHIERLSGDVGLKELYNHIETFCKQRKAGTWFSTHFSRRGWEVLISGRLQHKGYSQYPNQKGRWHK